MATMKCGEIFNFKSDKPILKAVGGIKLKFDKDIFLDFSLFFGLKLKTRLKCLFKSATVKFTALKCFCHGGKLCQCVAGDLAVLSVLNW